MKIDRRHFISTSFLGLLASNACKKPQLPPNGDAPGLHSANERAISYMIERQDGDKAKPVPEDFQFQSGDRFRLRFRPGFPAYIYIANRGADQSSYSILFPQSSNGDHNPLKTGAEVTLPGHQDWLRFDSTPGNENFVVVASTVPLSALDEAGTKIPRDTFETHLTEIEREYRPQSSRRFQDGDWMKFFAAREGDLALVVRLGLQHQ